MMGRQTGAYCPRARYRWCAAPCRSGRCKRLVAGPHHSLEHPAQNVACMDAGLVKGEGFAVDASVMEANASRYHGKTPDEIVWAEPERQTRAVKEYLAGLDVDAQPNPDRWHRGPECGVQFCDQPASPGNGQSHKQYPRQAASA